MRRTVFGVLMSMIIGGVLFIGAFHDPIAFVFTIYALPIIIFYGIPVARIAHKLTDAKQWSSTKRLFVYLVMGGWLPAVYFTTIYLTQDVYYNVFAADVGFIVTAMVFAFGFWLGEELFERTKLKEWSAPNLSST